MSGNGKATFDYWPTPTGVKFHASTSRVRVVIGPVGCLPGWTEVMTPRGWVRIDKWSGQQIAQWQQNSEIAFIKPKRYISAPYEGDMLSFNLEGGGSMVVTPNHRIVHRPIGSSLWRVTDALRLIVDTMMDGGVEIPSADGKVLRMETKPGFAFCADGRQYCFETDTGAFLVRQNGIVFVTGNSGKTWMNWMEIYRVTAERMPPMADGVIRARWVVIRNTYDELKSTTVATAQNIFNREGLNALEMHMSPPLEGWLRLPALDGRKMEIHLLFRAMDQPKAIDHLLGLEISGIYVNEMPQVPQAAVDSAMSRLGRYPPKDGDKVFPSLGVIADGNPLDQSNWVYRKMQELPEGWEFFNQPPALLRVVDPETNEVRYENNVGQDPAYPPAENVENHNEGFMYWRNQLGMAQDKIDRFILCKWVAKKAGRPVYPEWSPEFHVAKKPLEFSQNLPVIFGQDFGRTPCAVIGQVGLDGQIRILREITSDNMGIADFVTQKLRPTLINDFDLYHVKTFGFGDPAGADPTQVDDITCIETMNRLGLNVVPAPVTPYGVRGYHNSSVTRINNVSEVLNRRIGTAPAIVVDPSCKVLIGGFNGDYHYRRMRLDGVAEEDAKYTDEPDKGHPVSDVHDALQYFVCGVKNSGMDFSNPYAPDGYDDPGMAEALTSAGGMSMVF